VKGGAGIDVALWDIVGQALEKPVCQLLGHQLRSILERNVSFVTFAPRIHIRDAPVDAEPPLE
jgi:L-alanine-DL-glutamate epimerase-like enolase superfamily enzyme